MGNSYNGLSLKYNPHMIQKQARKWPASVCTTSSLTEDIIARNASIWNKPLRSLTDPFAVKLNIDYDLISEYGIDACRMAVIAAREQKVSLSHLESAHKWLAKFYHSALNCGPDNFDPGTWLETLYQSQDHLQQRQDPYSVLAIVRKSLKLSGINATLTCQKLQLAMLAIYPIAPVLSYYLMNSFNMLPLPSVESAAAGFSDLLAVRFRIKNSGWHWKVFNRQKFTHNPVTELKRVKWVAMAAQNRHIDVSKLKEGYEICLT